jgi:hypothetical protein
MEEAVAIRRYYDGFYRSKESGADGEMDTALLCPVGGGTVSWILSLYSLSHKKKPTATPRCKFAGHK